MPSINDRGLGQWLPGYLLDGPSRVLSAWARRSRLTHVIFTICDHYEPGHAATRDDQPAERVQRWHADYPRFQERCIAAFGHAPLHTWFYPPHHGEEHLPALASMAFGGGGEVELHYHHENDTAESLRRNMLRSLELYNRHGLLLACGAPPQRNFGFVHGDWTLDNARDGWKCGVNGELSVLKELGCWADFTMPSADASQTRKINSIYYATDSPSRCKSHNDGVDARAGVTDRAGFLLMQGPLAINWGAPNHPRIENANLTSENWGRPDRVRKWIDCNVHVKGRPDWLFVKLHTHGAIERDFDALFGDKAFAMHEMLNECYNDGHRFRLHYATARDAYNLVKAAEAGKDGDPSTWRDFAIPAPVTSLYALDATHTVRACTADLLEIDSIAGSAATRLKTRVGPVREIGGALESVRIDTATGVIELTSKVPMARLSVRSALPLHPADRHAQGAGLSRGERPDEWQVQMPEHRRIALSSRVGHSSLSPVGS